MALNLRGTHSLNANDRLTLKKSYKHIETYLDLCQRFRSASTCTSNISKNSKNELLKALKAAVLIQWLEILKVVVIEDLPPIPTITSRYPVSDATIIVHLRNLSIDVSKKFCSINIEQLRKVRDGF